jgi:hypothetical protein
VLLCVSGNEDENKQTIRMKKRLIELMICLIVGQKYILILNLISEFLYKITVIIN